MKRSCGIWTGTIGMLLCLFGSGAVLSAQGSGGLTALIVDEAGQPLPDVFVSVLNRTLTAVLPTQARTDSKGRVDLVNLAVGTYQITVRSADYRNPVSRLVDVLPHKTAVITLILQQLLNIRPEDENISLKALLRNGDQRRLIFKGLPGTQPPLEDKKPWSIEEAAIQVYSNGGIGDAYFVIPGDSWAGTTSNFAAEMSSSTPQLRHIVAGQLNSGSDSLWRIRNQMEYSLSENRSIRLFMGYGRLSFEQPSFALLDNPVGMDEHSEFARVSGRSKLLNVGFEDSLQFGPSLSLTWGIEVDQLRSGETNSFISPSASIRYEPIQGTEVSVATGSLRPTAANTVAMPNGEIVSLSTPLRMAQIGDELLFGTERHWIGAIRQSLGSSTEVEVALFKNQPLGDSMPLVAFRPSSDGPEYVRLDGTQANSRGLRVSARRSLTDNLRASVSYIRGTAPMLAGVSPVEFSSIGEAIRPGDFHGISSQLEAFLPRSGTHITALVKFLPGDVPLVNADPLADVYETGNAGVNLFIRQVIPVPAEWVRFFGLDPNSLPQIEALVDVRNILNDRSGSLQTGDGQVTMVQNPRSLRGGLALRF